VEEERKVEGIRVGGRLLPDAGVDGRPCPTVHPLISADLVTAAR